MICPHGVDDREATACHECESLRLRARIVSQHSASLALFCDELTDGVYHIADFDLDLIERLRRAIR
jgi:hypothetical protein